MQKQNLWSYIKSKDFWNQIKLMLAVFMGIILFSNFFLHCFTRHNSFVIVPNLYNLSVDEAQKVAKENKLKVDIVDSVFNLNLLPGTIVEQDPKPNTKVKKNRRILLIINAISPKTIAFPDIEGISLRQAVAVLDANGIQVGQISYVSDMATNLVLSSSYKGKKIKSGDMIKKGSIVNLTLGNAGNLRQTPVPNIIGLTLREARKQLSLSYLNIGKINYDPIIKNALDSINSIVYKQKPNASEGTLLMGSSVDLWLTIKKSE